MNFLENENKWKQRTKQKPWVPYRDHEQWIFGSYKYKWPIYLDQNNNINDQKVYNDYKIVKNYTMYTVCNKVFTKQ